MGWSGWLALWGIAIVVVWAFFAAVHEDEDEREDTQ
jgi:hypothetical protein